MITSVKNEKVKSWKKLQKRKERTEQGLFLIEGYHLVEEAWKSKWEIQEIIVQENSDVPHWAKGFSLEYVSDNVFQYISQTQTPQGIAATVKMKQQTTINGNQVLLIDAIQDPGNLGTIIRTADAAGFGAIILGNGTVDMYNDKVIRSTQGSLFHLPIFQANLEEKIPALQQDGFSIWASALANSKDYHTMDVPEKVALVVGNEGAGIQEQLLKLADSIVKIPIYGKAESLNVSIAAGILMYHLKG
ncbi:TrmH family RNA methyltransferase [Ornithinibacillus halophilus]|uniref:RNA methyltransferase, TrmH family n=1 Tax=Ornithinibacillus halophilus TaxID=930117 RepID=A0A1M5J1Z7_9BACI|nr:RNA methyltransferase [Ornithinibacillus halophilus]SHG34617.1 RNA methyltransferase, TrmH family [Ornithinibacillus halophilus]